MCQTSMLVHVPGVATVSWWQKSGNTKIKRVRLCTQPAKQGASCDTRSVDATHSEHASDAVQVLAFLA